MHYEIIIADDHPLYRAALCEAVGAACAGSTIHQAHDVSALFTLLEQLPETDLLLLDLNMPGAHGFSALAHLRGAYPQLPVVVVSAQDDSHTVMQALAFGAQGFISKSADAGTIGLDVQAVLDGMTVRPAGMTSATDQSLDPGTVAVARRLAELTPQQFRVFGMLCSGRLNKQIAYELAISEATVKAHMTALLRKLGATSRTQAVLLAGRLALDPQQRQSRPQDAD